ncbi:MAG: hypothetical protein ABIH99_03965 [Candidatus Micrarchaeota archaeon]
MSGENAVKALKLSVVSLTAVFGFSLIGAFFIEGAVLKALFSLSALLLMACLALLFMALRKFGNEEMEVGSQLVKRANFLGFGAFGALVIALAINLHASEPLASYVFIALSALIFGWVLSFGKKKFKYW